MAGGNISPRQKMINMMYLVLLALLAMNISKEILEYFQILGEKLETSAIVANDANNAFVMSMKEEIQKEIENEKKMTNAKLPDTLDAVRARTNRLIGLIDQHIAEMNRIGVVDTATGKLVNMDENDLTHQYWIGKGDGETQNSGRGAGKARELRDSIDSYIAFVAAMYNSQLRSEEAKKSRSMDPEKRKIQDYVGKHKEFNDTWERHYFKAPVVAIKSFLPSIKSDVYEMEKELLTLFNERLGVATFKIDKLVAIDAPTATIVPAGLQFQTRLYVAMSSSQVKPNFSGSGNIQKDADGNSAVMTIPASGSVIPQGKKEGIQTYSATVSVPKATGGVEQLAVKGQFTVRIPEIVVTSATVQNLYRNCGNAINIDVPALGDLYNPVISASEASATQSKESKIKWLIVPTGRKCIVSVSTNTNGQTIKVGNVDYSVIEPPMPGLNMLVNGREYNGTSPVPNTSRVVVKVVPDAEFKAALPQDARYGITSIDVKAQLSLGPPQTVNAVNSADRDAVDGIEINLGPQVRSAPPGTKVYVVINQVFRRNFRGERVDDNRFTEVTRTLSLVTK